VSDNENDWIEKELARQFAAVRAPDSLWSRVESARRGARSASLAGTPVGPRAGWILWPAVATMLLFASGDLLWEIGKARASIAPLTEQDLEAVADGSACDFKSSDPAQIERWVKAKTSMNVNLSCGRPGNAQLVGARLIRKRGAVIAAIAYQVGNDAATLLVSDKHSLFRWNREYSIAWSGSKENPGACNQCHLDARSQL
jgi:hypothetical protein